MTSAALSLMRSTPQDPRQVSREPLIESVRSLSSSKGPSEEYLLSKLYGSGAIPSRPDANLLRNAIDSCGPFRLKVGGRNGDSLVSASRALILGKSPDSASLLDSDPALATRLVHERRALAVLRAKLKVGPSINELAAASGVRSSSISTYSSSQMFDDRSIRQVAAEISTESDSNGTSSVADKIAATTLPPEHELLQFLYGEHYSPPLPAEELAVLQKAVVLAGPFNIKIYQGKSVKRDSAHLLVLPDGFHPPDFAVVQVVYEQRDLLILRSYISKVHLSDLAAAIGIDRTDVYGYIVARARVGVSIREVARFLNHDDSEAAEKSTGPRTPQRTLVPHYTDTVFDKIPLRPLEMPGVERAIRELGSSVVGIPLADICTAVEQRLGLDNGLLMRLVNRGLFDLAPHLPKPK